MSTIGTSLIFFYLATFASSTEFKTIDLCPEKTPQNIRKQWKPNHHKMRDLMTEAAIFSEHQMKTGGEYYGPNSPNASERSHVGTKTPVLGSMDFVTDTGHDAGLLSTIYEAYGNHYNLRTGPEDWWYTVIQTIALVIDRNSKSDEVRNFFVQHEGKKKLEVIVAGGPYKVEDLDYSWLFDQFSQKIEENINVPEYVQQMIPNFSTTSITHRIVSQITLMSSVQEFFEYVSGTVCGIPFIEMKGTEKDWIDLGLKIKTLRTTLEPLEDLLSYSDNWKVDNWWDEVEEITKKLLDTFRGNPNEDWWSKIITERKYGSGAPRFNGWFMKIFLNVQGAATIGSAPSGLVSIPMTFSDGTTEEQGAVVAGMLGYKFHQGQRNLTRPAVEPMHGWTLLLEPNSVFRKDLTDWEEKINGVSN